MFLAPLLGAFGSAGAAAGGVAAGGSALGSIGAAASLGSSLLSAAGAISQGNAAAAQAEYQAKMDKVKANEATAQSSQEVAQKYQDQARLLGNQTALAAASGGGAGDPSILDLAGDVGGYGYQQRQGIVANGRNVANSYMADAVNRRMEAKSALSAGRIGAFGTILSGVSSAASKYSSLMPR